MCGDQRVDEQLGERRVFGGWCSSSSGAQLIRRRVGAQFARHRQSAGVGVGAFGGGSVCVRETRAASRRNPREVIFLFHLGFWGVCVCVRPRPLE